MHLWDWRARLMRPENRATEGLRQDPALAALLGRSFFSEIWGTRPRVVPWSPLVADDWEQVVRDVAGALLGSRDALIADGEGPRLLGAGDLVDWAGKRVVLRDAHIEHEGIGRLQEAFRAWFRCPVTTALVLEGPGAPDAPERHHAHHGFAVQLVGDRRWILGPAVVPWPERRFRHEVDGVHADRPHPVAAGQLLYLPPGVRQRVADVQGLGIHLVFEVHQPRLHDVVESAIDAQAARDVSIRAPVHLHLRDDGVRWGAHRGQIAGALRQLADRLEARPRVLPEGTPVGALVDDPVVGEWPVENGRFARREPRSSRLLQVARTGAAVLVEGLDEVVGVYATGSVLTEPDPTKVKDLDLVVVCRGQANPKMAQRVVGTLATVAGSHPPFDPHAVFLDALLSGEGSAWPRLCLAVEAELLAGEPVWQEPPVIEATLELGVALFREAKAQFGGAAEALKQGNAPPNATAWLQKRALRLGGIRALVQAGRFVRHPDGCVAWVERLLPDLGGLARVVRDELYTGADGAAVRERALKLGDALIRR